MHSGDMNEIYKIKSKINKEYFEYYAKYSLVSSHDKMYTYLSKAESPDWQSRRLNIGLEVTRAIDKDIYLAHHIIYEYFGNVFINGHIAQKIIERRNQYFDMYGTETVEYDDLSNIENLKNSYIHKTRKLNTNYTKYSQNQLYMFTFKSMDTEEVRSCLDVDLSHFEINYDICFVNCFNRLYVCDFMQREIIHTINVDDECLQKIKKKALRKSHIK